MMASSLMTTTDVLTIVAGFHIRSAAMIGKGTNCEIFRSDV